MEWRSKGLPNRRTEKVPAHCILPPLVLIVDYHLLILGGATQTLPRGSGLIVDESQHSIHVQYAFYTRSALGRGASTS